MSHKLLENLFLNNINLFVILKKTNHLWIRKSNHLKFFENFSEIFFSLSLFLYNFTINLCINYFLNDKQILRLLNCNKTVVPISRLSSGWKDVRDFDKQIKINSLVWRTKIGLWQNLIRFRGIDVSSLPLFDGFLLFPFFTPPRSSACAPVDNRILFEKNEKGNEILIRKLSLGKRTACYPTAWAFLLASHSCFY